jgi:hypothetical protein
MLGRLRARLAGAYGLVAHSLSGRLLLLTIVFVMVGEVLIFVPSIGRYHRELLDNHIESAELAILPFTEPGGEQLSAALRRQLLKRAGAAAVVLNRAEQRECSWSRARRTPRQVYRFDEVDDGRAHARRESIA